MNVWCFLGTLMLFWSQLCHADPANNMVIGYNCTGFTLASPIFVSAESFEAINDTKLPWYMKWFSSSANTILDVVKTYPPIPNENCTITCVRIQDLANTAALVEKIAGGIGYPNVTVHMKSKPKNGLLLNIAIDGFCNITVNDSQINVPELPPPLVSPPNLGWIEKLTAPQSQLPIGWHPQYEAPSAPPLPRPQTNYNYPGGNQPATHK